MSEKNVTYLEKQIEAVMKEEKGQITVTFQRAKLKLNDEEEVHLLGAMNPEFDREFKLTEDQLIITIKKPEHYVAFSTIHKKSNQAKWQFAFNVIQAIRHHAVDRLKLIVSPENVLFDHGLNPHFLHYGVKESLPPYEDDGNRLWLETKAIVATIIDDKYDFNNYLSHYETLQLNAEAKKVMNAESYDDLFQIIGENLKKDEAYEKTVLHVPRKKWKLQRYIQIALAIILVPAIIYTIFAAFFKIPQTEAYVSSSRSFLEQEYSEVINKLSNYDHEGMPYVVQYQLASAYVVNESLTEVQRQNIQNTLTLQSDRNYFNYWIDIGRGNYQEAIDTARRLEDRDLIIYGLLKQREEVKSDQSLSGEERQERLSSIQSEIDEYRAEKEQEALEQEEAEQEAAEGDSEGNDGNAKSKENQDEDDE
ncbi:type VII secretion protein EssB [Salipaludibacillus sp. LMS25]|jgi:type VII secretion protein EssB|uniref:type VII secretion protein EssB n=1 Tax=Salipaludibacillus sp. LMS25 TaxID=2924031 RepID=UPI0020D01502|nr:type VII secretion protein EssB [Salipaludibacillus sp. LMS25]UTR16189.1 type VII secretion protein EssB [Salipaludibacillus sp. LMS25]